VSVVLILGSNPRPLLLQVTGVPHISFPVYTRKEAITIITASDPPAVDNISEELISRLYPQFVVTVYDSLIGPTAGTITSFRAICEKLWPKFLAPVLDGSPPGVATEWDFARLLVKNRALFRQQGEAMLTHHIADPDDIVASNVSEKPPMSAPISRLPPLPYFPTLVLTAAYLASHTSSRSDTVLFSKFSASSKSARKKLAHHRRRLKSLSLAQADHNRDEDIGNPSAPRKGRRLRTTRVTESNIGSVSKDPSAILTTRPFTLERLIAIYHAVDPNPPVNPVRAPAVADSVYMELATLRRLRLIVPVSGTGSAAAPGLSGGGSGGGTTADASEKWRINISPEWIAVRAKEIGVDVGEWLGGR
jgi:origin recognition complex subunit 5